MRGHQVLVGVVLIVRRHHRVIDRFTVSRMLIENSGTDSGSVDGLTQQQGLNCDAGNLRDRVRLVSNVKDDSCVLLECVGGRF